MLILIKFLLKTIIYNVFSNLFCTYRVIIICNLCIILFKVEFILFIYFSFRYYGLKPKLDEAHIRIKELERENEFLKWSKVLHTNNSEKSTIIDCLKKTLSDVQTQTQSILYVDKVCFHKKNQL